MEKYCHNCEHYAPRTKLSGTCYAPPIGNEEVDEHATAYWCCKNWEPKTARKVSWGGWGMPELIREKHQKARKEYCCDWCGKPIHVGDFYTRQVYRGDDCIYDWKAHEECNRIAEDFWDVLMDDDGDGCTSDDFAEACGEFCSAFGCKKCDVPECDRGYGASESCEIHIYYALQECKLDWHLDKYGRKAITFKER